jgi:serine/threonine protein kinase
MDTYYLKSDRFINDIQYLMNSIETNCVNYNWDNNNHQFVNNLNVYLGKNMSIDCCKFFKSLKFPINEICFQEVCKVRLQNDIIKQRKFIKWYLNENMPINSDQQIDKELCEDTDICEILLTTSSNTSKFGFITEKNWNILKVMTNDSYHKVLLVKTDKNEYKILKCMIDYEEKIYSKLNIFPHKNIASYEEQYYCFEHANYFTNYIKKFTQFPYYKYTFSSMDFNILNKEIKYKIIKELIDGVSHIHQLGFYHGDLKPDNICITEEYVVKIIDFETCDYSYIQTEEKNSFPFITPLSYFHRIEDDSFFKKKYDNIEYSESGIKNDIYVVALLILYILSGIKVLKIELEFELEVSETKVEMDETKKDIKMMEEIEKTNGLFWFKIFSPLVVELTDKQRKCLEKCLQSDETKRSYNLLYKLRNLF